MMAPLVGNSGIIGFHPVYVACAIGFGSQCGNWMNDSGFGIFARMSGLRKEIGT
jgi:GntP family gluconate:H+ symporter